MKFALVGRRFRLAQVVSVWRAPVPFCARQFDIQWETFPNIF